MLSPVGPGPKHQRIRFPFDFLCLSVIEKLKGMDMRRREVIKACAAIAAGWPFPAGAPAPPAPSHASPTRPVLTPAQSEALEAYNKAVNQFKSILAERRAQISSHQSLPNLPGQALYLARINVMSTYKDLTDALPSKIGR